MSQNQGQNQQREYKERQQSGSNNPRWEPTKNENNQNYPRQIEGYFKSFREMPGNNGPFMVAEIQLMNQDGTLAGCVDVPGGKVLENKLSEIPLGAWIMIEFKGKIRGKSGNTYNDFRVFEDENAIPLHTLLGKPAPMQNSGQQNQQQNNTPVFNGQNNQPAQQQNNPFGQGQQQQQQSNTFNGNQNTAPFFNQNNGQQNSSGQGQNQAPAFNQNNNQGGNGTWTPPANNTPVFNGQNNQPAQQQNNPFGQGQQQQGNGNPFQSQNDGDLPF